MGCAASAPHHPADTIVVRAQQEPDSLNPFLSGMSAAADAFAPIFSGLLQVDDRLRFVPDLATAVPTSENGGVAAEGKGMRVTYHLRRGVTWHDGKPFTSADVRFTWRFVTDPRAMVVERTGYDLITGVDAPDPYTVTVHYKEVYAPYLQLFNSILPAHLLDHAKDPNQDAFNRAPIGTGPFRFVAWRSGDRLTYTANDRYFRGKPAFEKLEFRFIPDDNAAFIQLKNSAIDVYQTVSLAQFHSLDRFPGVTVYKTSALTREHLAFNLDRPYFKDVRVRRAIAQAINKDLIADKAYDGLYHPAWSDQFPQSWAYSPDLVGKLPYDPAAANKLLDEAGWARGADGVRQKDGVRFSLRFATTAGKKPRETTQLLIRHFLHEVGIDVQIDNHPGATLFGAPPSGILKGGHFDIAMWAWDQAPDPDNLNTWDSKRIPPNGSNSARYRNPAVDALVEAGTRTFRQSERQTIYRKVSHILADDVPDIPLLYWTVLDAVSDRIENFKPNPTNAGNLWNVYEWRIRPEKP